MTNELPYEEVEKQKIVKYLEKRISKSNLTNEQKQQ